MSKTQEAIHKAQDEMSGVGLDNFTSETLAVSYLSMVQPDSTASMNHAPGTWRATATDANFGDTVRVIPIGFSTVWIERDPTTFMTIGRYAPQSIEVEVIYPKPGQKGFPVMHNKASGNKVEELFAYAVLLADDLNAGVHYFTPTLKSMSACKRWNSMIRSAKLGSGLPGGICSFKWDLKLSLIPNPAKPASKISVLEKATCAGEVEEDILEKDVKPQLGNVTQLHMLAEPDPSDKEQQE